MQPLARPTRLAERMDRVGMRLLALLAAFLWFYLLWGRVVPALMAGGALAVMFMLVIRMGEKRTLRRREDSLRRRIGGELAVDSLPMQTSENAAANAAAWLSSQIPLTDFEPVADGVLAKHEDERVYCTCLQKHSASRAGRDDVLSAVRAAREHGADVCVVCSTCNFASEAVLLAEDLQPRTRLLGRDGLIRMAGAVTPATDEQLQALGRLRRHGFQPEVWKARILNPSKAKRYGAYGLGMMVMFLFTRRMIYLIPAVVCLLLFYLSRRVPQKPFTL